MPHTIRIDHNCFFLRCSLCGCRCRWKKAWIKPSNTSAESWSIKPTISIFPNPRRHEWKKADPDTTEELCSSQGYWRTLPSGFSHPLKQTSFWGKTFVIFFAMFWKAALIQNCSKEFISVKCASNLQTLPCTLVCQSSVCLFKISLDHVRFVLVFTFCVLIDVIFLSVSN